ncbi:MAG: ATP-binding cassette domain-containing protein, partial [Rubricoccaceae bacterium]|nr:ATP-binding cassette domain-containing protein [Rubricoccaceae bacterium]
MLTITNLHASVEDHEILKGLSLDVKPGEVHAIMGPNGSGKSTLAGVLAGKEDYEISQGSIHFKGEDLTEMDPEERAREGLFLAFQYPVELPGVSTMQFLKTAVNSVRAHRGQDEMNVADFLTLMREKAAFVNLDPRLMQRAVNEGFSGGEKKR